MNRTASDGVRWLSAVLILTGIVAIAALVREWPAAAPAARAPIAPLLASQPLPMFAAPVPPRPASVSAARHTVVDVVPPPLVASASPAVTDVEQTPVSPRDPLPPVAASVPVIDAGEPAVLASRRVEITVVPQTRTADIAPEAVEDEPGLVEFPAVVVTRAVSVAGRGIRTGVRATSALLRAAF